MERTELIRTRHRPDWLSILLGVVATLAAMGILSLIGMGFRLLRITPADTIPAIVLKLLWLIGSVTSASFVGGFVAGLSMPAHNRIAAAMDGFMVTEFTILIFASMAYFGFDPLPGLTFAQTHERTAPEALLWWAMMLALPSLFSSAYGAMQGNDLGHAPELTDVEEIYGPLETEKLQIEKSQRRPAA